MKNNQKTPLCPRCKTEATLQNTVYGIRYDHCNLWAWGNFPLVDKETHELRKIAHSRFDPLWQSGKMKRKQAYTLLARSLGISLRKCHMKLMGKETLRRVLIILEEEEKKNAQ